MLLENCAVKDLSDSNRILVGANKSIEKASNSAAGEMISILLKSNCNHTKSFKNGLIRHMKYAIVHEFSFLLQRLALKMTVVYTTKVSVRWDSSICHL